MGTKIQNLIKEVGRNINRNSPSILTGLGVGGFVTSIVLAVKATPKALSIIEDELLAQYKLELESYGTTPDAPRIALNMGPEVIDWEPLTIKDKAVLTWQCYAPAAGMVVLSATCIIMANRISLRRNAALASLYSIVEGGLRDYQAKVVQTVGAKKEELIRGEVADDALTLNPVNEHNVIVTTKGSNLCYDSLSGRYFTSDIEWIRSGLNDFNHDLINVGYLTLNDFYYILELPGISLGENMGWHIDDGQLELQFTSNLTKGTPCIVVQFKPMPKVLWV